MPRFDLIFVHDERDRLVEVRSAKGTLRYRYDASGNLEELEAHGAVSPQRPTCRACRAPAHTDDRFCRNCGAPLR